MKITSVEIAKLYKTKRGEILIPFTKGRGIGLIKKYKNEIVPIKDNKRIFIKIFLSKENVVNGTIDMIDFDKKRDDAYVITDDPNKYGRKITNFSFGEEENLFLSKEKGVFVKTKNKYISINNFVDVLIKNHLSDKLFLKRKINQLIDYLIKFIFWLDNQRYEPSTIFLIKNGLGKHEEKNKPKTETPEPFFKYFYIKKNFLLSLLLMSLIIISTFIIRLECSDNHFGYSIFLNLSLSNPVVILVFIVFLFIAEKISSKLDSLIEGFYENDKKNILNRIDQYKNNSSFRLRFN